MILADKIITLRKQNGWSQEELAERLNVSRQSISKWESAQSVPDLNKIIKLGAVFGVTTDYLLKDELEALTGENAVTGEVEVQSGRFITLELAQEYLGAVAAAAGKIAAGAAICVLSPSFLIALAGSADAGRYAISENFAAGIGIAVLLMLVTLGVMLLLGYGMKLSPYEYIGKETLSLDYGVEGLVRKKKEAFADTHRKSIIIGVALIILSTIPLVSASIFTENVFFICLCVSLLLLMVACGVFLFVWSDMIHSSYLKLLQEGDYRPNNKRIERKASAFYASYWLIATALYLAFSFVSNLWDISWIIWPLAGVLYPVYVMFIRAVIVKK